MTGIADLTSLLASRICHDLVSPVGAIVNGSDLVGAIGAGDASEEIAMISQSAARASALLQFYRIAFGAANDDRTLSREAVEAQAERMLATPKIGLEWEGLQGPALTRTEGRLLFQMLMCARAVVGMRGRITVRLDPENSLPLAITVLSQGPQPGKSPSAAPLNQDVLSLLATEPEAANVTARQVEFALVHHSARQLGATLSVSTYGDSARIEAKRR